MMILLFLFPGKIINHHHWSMLIPVKSLPTVTSRVSTVLLLSAGSLVVYLHSIQSLNCLNSCGYSASTRCCQIRQSPGAPVCYRATPDQGLFINYFAHYLDKTLRRTTLYCTSNRAVATVVCPWHCRLRCSVVGFFVWEIPKQLRSGVVVVAHRKALNLARHGQGQGCRWQTGSVKFKFNRINLTSI